MDVLRTHPIAAVGTAVYDNFYYVPPAELLGPNIAAAELRHCLENLSDRRQADETLRENEAKYRSLFENMLNGLAYCKILLDEKGQPTDFIYLEVNSSFERLTGLKKEDVIGKRVTEAIPTIKDTDPGLFDIYGEVALTGIESEFDVYFQPLEIWLSISVYSPQKEYFVAVFENITERKRAEEALRESEQKYRTLFDESRDPVYITTREGKFLDCNQPGLDLFGYSRAEMLRLNARELYVRAADREKFQHAIETAKSIKDYEVKFRRKDGTEIDCLVTSTVRLGQDGSVLGYQGIIRDITERKRTEETLADSQRQLRRLSTYLQWVREEERKGVAREIHDELGQAFTAQKMDLSWLVKRVHKDQKSLLEKAKEMSTLIDSTAGTVKRICSELRPGLLDDLGLTAAIEWQAGEFQKRTGIECDLTIKPEEVVLTEDYSIALFRIFQEILANVARHGEATNVEASLIEKEGRIELTVKDNGKGITGKQISSPESFGILGMRERVLFLDGEFDIRGKKNRETTVRVSVPVRRSA